MMGDFMETKMAKSQSMTFTVTVNRNLLENLNLSPNQGMILSMNDSVELM